VLDLSVDQTVRLSRAPFGERGGKRTDASVTRPAVQGGCDHHHPALRCSRLLYELLDRQHLSSVRLLFPK